MRYELRIIRSNYNQNGHEIQPLDAPIFESDDIAEMNLRADAEGSSHYYGVAIVDNKNRTVDWGDEITALDGEVTVGELKCWLALGL